MMELNDSEKETSSVTETTDSKEPLSKSPSVTNGDAEQVKQLEQIDGEPEAIDQLNSSTETKQSSHEQSIEDGRDENNNPIKDSELSTSNKSVEPSGSHTSVNMKPSNSKITEIWHFTGEVQNKNSQSSSVGEESSKETQYFERSLSQTDICDQNVEIFIPRKDSLKDFKNFALNNYSSQDNTLYPMTDTSRQSLKQNEYNPYESIDENNNPCTLRDPREYYYASSEESDIEVLIKIPKMAIADYVLEELSTACPSFTIKSIGMPEKIKQEDNPEYNPEYLKDIPKPYTNIFPDDNKQVHHEPEVSELYSNKKTQHHEQTREDGQDEENPQTFLTSNQVITDEKLNLNANFSSLHEKFDPSKISTKHSASTLTEPMNNTCGFWKAFVDDPSTLVDKTQTTVQQISNPFPNTDSAKASDSQLEVVGIDSPVLTKAVLSMTSCRTFTLSSGFSPLNVVGNVEVALDHNQQTDRIFDKIGARSEQLQQKSELCTSDTSVSSASEMHKGRKQSRRQNAKLKTNIHNKFNTKQFKETMPTEGTVTDEVKERNFDAEVKAHRGYSNSSSSCFSLPDEAETDNYDGEDNVKEGVFPFITSPDDQLGKETPPKFRYGGDELGTMRKEKFGSDPFDEETNFEETAQSNVLIRNAPSSVKSSKGSVYSVGASLPPIPSTIRSQKSIISNQSRSPRMGRLALQSKRIVLNKVKLSSTMSRRVASERTLRVAAPTKSKCSDYHKPHECDSINGLLLSDNLDEETITCSDVDGHKGTSSTIAEKSYESISSKKILNLTERGREQRVPRRPSKVRHWFSSLFRWCDVRNTMARPKQARRHPNQ